MAKRSATTEINHDNWDEDYAPEEPGTFSKASDDALKKRVIKVAKRRNPISQSEEGKSPAFGSFVGFGKTPSVPSTSKAFGFLSNLTSKTETPKTNGISEENSSDKKLDEYYAKLKGLNESVTEWITNHVNENPFVNLQPVFKDYDKYFNDLEKLKKDASDTKSEHNTASASTVSIPQFSFSSTIASSSFPKFSFGTTSVASGGFSFGSNTSTSTTNSPVSSSDSSDKPISFGTTSGDSGKFSFTSTIIKPADIAKPEDAEEEGPPKVEFTPVVEEGHIYTVRCKVFVKKDAAFADHGVGNLYLKPVPDMEKIQLIVRNDTNLGKLLCNFILSENIPMQRTGKKDVLLVCIPTPEMQSPVPILLRVKSPEAADELLKTLQKHKK